MADQSAAQDVPISAKLILHPEATNTRQFQFLGELKRFFDTEYDFWNQHSFPNSNLRTMFKGTRGQLNALTPTSSKADVDKAVAEVEARMNGSTVLIYSETSAGTFLAQLHKENPTSAQGAYEFLTSENLNSGQVNNRAYWRGILAAHHFRYGGISEGKFNAENDLLVQLRSSATNLLTSTREELQQYRQVVLTEFEAFQSKTQSVLNEFRVLRDGSKSESDAWLASVKVEHEAWRQETIESAKSLLQGQQEGFVERARGHDQALNAIQSAFKEQARLQEPAKYWSDMVSTYEGKAKQSRKFATLAGAILAAGILLLLMKPPSVMEGAFLNVRMAILIAVFLSVGAYFVALFVRLATSAEHLARDARERLQLTHVYLALLKDGAVDAKEREIVLHAIFSSADTGLLKGDGGPTMPTPLGNLFDALKK
jgi:hypothetical protein